MNQNLFASADFLRAANNTGYGMRPIPQPRDNEIASILRAWMALDELARKEAASRLLDEQRFVLLAYSERMASLAVRQKEAELLVLGLVALGVDGWHADWRDNALIVSLHHDAAQRIGASADDIFERAAIPLPPRAAEGLRSFLRRSARDRSLEAMGYTVSADRDGFRYARTW